MLIPAENVAALTLHYLGLSTSRPSLVVIGAMDGVSFDGLHEYIDLYRWSGLFVEPIPEQFRRLVSNYTRLGHTQNRYENSAVADHDGTVKMLTIDQQAVDEGRVPACFGGMSAIYPPRNGLASAGDASTVARYGKLVEVECVTLETLFHSHRIDQVDVLSIDAEGWDHRILRQLDFSRYRPVFIRCEYINLRTEEKSGIAELLAGQGYLLHFNGQNLDAVRTDVWEKVMSARPFVPPSAKGNSPRPLTLVTGLFDLLEGEADPQPPNTFGMNLDHVEQLLRADCPMVIFSQPRFIDLLRRCRTFLNSHVVRKTRADLEAFPYYDHVQRIRERTLRLAQPGWRPAGPGRRLALHNPFAMSKQFFLNEAALVDPFESETFLWLDADLAGEIADLPARLTPDVLRTLVSRLDDNRMSYLCRPLEDGERIPGFSGARMATLAGRKPAFLVSGRVFGGTRRALNGVNPLYDRYLDQTLNSGDMGTEEHVLTILTHAHPEWCREWTLPVGGGIAKFFDRDVDGGGVRGAEERNPVSPLPPLEGRGGIRLASLYGSHNAALTVLNRGVFQVAELERFTNRKNMGLTGYMGDPAPERLLSELLAHFEAELDIVNDFDICVHSETDAIRDGVRVAHAQQIRAQRYATVSHHRAHAAGAFYQSPYDRALVISFDGGGGDGFFNVYLADRRESVRQIARLDVDLGFPYMIFGQYLADVRLESDLSVGNLVYPGKIMGLSAYGRPRREWLDDFREFYRAGPDGNNYTGLLAELGERIGVQFDSTSRLRDPLAPDIAATSQRAFEETFLELASPFLKEYRHVPLCLTGGCALNIILNTRLDALHPAPVFVPPNPNDCGLSVGMALDLLRPEEPVDVTYAGLPPLDLRALPEFAKTRGAEPLDIDACAALFDQGRIVGVVRGRAEHGPRALGNRSILCSPCDPTMKDRLNDRVKKREWFRPFAPVVRLEHVSRYFEIGHESRWMSFCPLVRPEWRERIPAVVHVDGTARVQTVTREQHPFLYDLLGAFEQRTGVGVLLNTSFNRAGRPLIGTYADALWMLDNSGLDALVGDDFLFRRAQT